MAPNKSPQPTPRRGPGNFARLVSAFPSRLLLLWVDEGHWREET